MRASTRCSWTHGSLAPVEPVEPLPLAEAQLIEPLQVLVVQLIDALHVPFVRWSSRCTTGSIALAIF
jgi:hypothetical protein